jgi:propanol-preferring alcohol dehydrogenase
LRAQVLEAQGKPLRLAELPRPSPGVGEILVRVGACGVCRTDLHVRDGDLASPNLPLILGHEIVGRVVSVGDGVKGFETGQRVGIPWLGTTCGHCRFCIRGAENLCEDPGFTGYTRDGGYAEYTVADHRFCFPLGPGLDDASVAPLLCAGLIGYRSLKMAGDARRIGIYGFGAAAHLVCQVALFEGREVYAFTRPGDESTQLFARSLGATWAGGSGDQPPALLDAAIIFAPVGGLVPIALRHLDKGGVVVCAGIHMSEIPSFPYDILWGERSIRSVANLTREDGASFLALADKMSLRATSEIYPLDQANRALDDLAAGRLEGAAVLVP